MNVTNPGSPPAPEVARRCVASSSRKIARGVSGSLYYAGVEYRTGADQALVKIGTGHSWKLSHFTVDFSWLALNIGAGWRSGGAFIMEYEAAAALNIPLFSWLGLQVRAFGNGGFTVGSSDGGQVSGGVSIGLLVGSNHSDVDVIRHRPETEPLVVVEGGTTAPPAGQRRRTTPLPR